MSPSMKVYLPSSAQRVFTWPTFDVPSTASGLGQGRGHVRREVSPIRGPKAVVAGLRRGPATCAKSLSQRPMDCKLEGGLLVFCRIDE